MNPIKSILAEEAMRLEELCKKYREEIARLPGGSISIKKRGNNEYLYLAGRARGKVRFRYIGKADSPEANEIRAEVEKRKKYQKLLRQARQNLKELKRVIR